MSDFFINEFQNKIILMNDEGELELFNKVGDEEEEEESKPEPPKKRRGRQKGFKLKPKEEKNEPKKQKIPATLLPDHVYVEKKEQLVRAYGETRVNRAIDLGLLGKSLQDIAEDTGLAIVAVESVIDQLGI